MIEPRRLLRLQDRSPRWIASAVVVLIASIILASCLVTA
jgi:hypothetical protein